MAVAAIAVFGWVSYDRLPLNLMPDISYPSLTVRTDAPGMAPEEVENLISRPIEQALGVVGNLEGISSVSRAGLSDVVLEFGWDTEMDQAMQKVREKLDRIHLPELIEKPLILRYDPTLDPIMRLGLYGVEDRFLLRRVAKDEIKRELERLKGIAAARVRGGLEEEIRVELRESMLATMGLSIQDVNRRLQEENVNLAGGKLEEGEIHYLVRTLSEFRDIEEMADLVVGEKNNVEVRLRDVGRVFRTHKEREIITRVNGRESAEIDIFKEGDANIVAVAQKVRNRTFGLAQQRQYLADFQAGMIETKVDTVGKTEDEIRAERTRKAMEKRQMADFLANNLPEGMRIEILSDQSGFIESAINDVKQAAVIGGVLAVLILYIFLRNIGHTLIVGISIPISVVATFAPMNIFEVSLNIMSLGGLALGIGMLVDNSIVVLESIFRCRQEGDDLVAAAIRGTKEVGGAVLAATLTTMAVFFPIVFVEGVAGQVFGDMALVVVFSLLASLAAALFLLPMLASRRISTPGGRHTELLKADILKFRAVDRIREVTAGPKPLRAMVGVYGHCLKAMPLLAWEWLWRTLLILTGTICVILKFVSILLGITLWPLTKALERFIKFLRGFYPKLNHWSQGIEVFGWKAPQRVWDRLMVFTAAEEIGSDLPNGFQWAVSGLKGGPWYRIAQGIVFPIVGCGWFLISCGHVVISLVGRKPRDRARTAIGRAWGGAKVIFVPILLVYFYSRFVAHLTLALTGKVLISTAMLVGVSLISTGWIAGLIVAPGLALLVYTVGGAFNRLSEVYPRVIGWALSHRMEVISAGAGAFVITILFLGPHLGRELMPVVHQGEFSAEISLPVGTPLEVTDRRIRDLERSVMDQGEVSRVSTVVGTERDATSSSEEGENTARITALLRREGDLALAEEGTISDLRERWSGIPEVTTKFSRPALFSFKTPIEVEIRGHDLGKLRRLAGEAEAALSRINGLTDIKSNLQRGNPEVQISYDRDNLARYGLNLKQVATLVRNKIQGQVATRFRERERRLDVLVKLDEADRQSIRDIQNLVINPNSQVRIPLSAVAEVRIQEGPSEIRRIDQQRTALLTANLADLDMGTASARIYDVLSRMEMPQGFEYLVTGQNREMETSLRSLRLALLLAMFLVYIVMASQFESFLHPFVIMLTIPLAMVGVVLALVALGISINVMVFLGGIVLAGVVVNNAIVLINYTNILRARGMSKIDALVQAGHTRLRPIMMTTLTTVLGLTPIALGVGEGAELRIPLAVTVIAGLTSSTVLTLVVIPVVYAVLDRKD